MSKHDPALARAALAGLEAYEKAARSPRREMHLAVASASGAALRDLGGDGPPLVLVPSLINPPHILDLDEDVSLAGLLAASGQHVLLVDWGPAARRAKLGIAGHVEQLLMPLLGAVGAPATLVGYCLGGTMTMAAAALTPVRGLVTLAAPWHFDGYPEESRASLASLWAQSRAASEQLGALPMEVLQAGFWALDPERTVRKFAEFGTLDPESAAARRFVTLEDWANEGDPLPLPAAGELFDAFYAGDAPGSGQWKVGGRIVAEEPPVRTLHVIAGEDRIVPPASAPGGNRVTIASGHVGMIVGRARTQLHEALRRFLASR